MSKIARRAGPYRPAEERGSRGTKTASDAPRATAAKSAFRSRPRGSPNKRSFSARGDGRQRAHDLEQVSQHPRSSAPDDVAAVVVEMDFPIPARDFPKLHAMDLRF